MAYRRPLGDLCTAERFVDPADVDPFDLSPLVCLHWCTVCVICQMYSLGIKTGFLASFALTLPPQHLYSDTPEWSKQKEKEDQNKMH